MEREETRPFLELSLRAMWDRLADPRAAPGGGSAAAVAAGMAAALVAKAARRSADSWSEARGVAAQAGSLASRCSELAESDSRAFAAALQALDEGTAIQVHLDRAAVVLLALGEAAADVAELAVRTAEHCDGTFRGDAVSAALLAEGAALCAVALVATNLTVAEGDERLIRARRFAETATTAARRAFDAGP